MTYPFNGIIIKMINYSKGNLHDIDHLMKVYAYSALIGERELDDEDSIAALKIAAILHDIACPLCRKKYGKADGAMQELEGAPMTRDFLADFCLPEALVEKIVWLVSHHHTYSDVIFPEHRILLEADFIVNAAESRYSRQQILAARKSFFRSTTGTSLLDSIFLSQE